MWNSNFDFIIIGDFNSRIAECQTLSKHAFIEDAINIFNQRNSKDIVLNANGRDILDLFDDLNIIILNGRVVDDSGGEFTYVGSRGSSVIDLCEISYSLMYLVKLFKVDCQVYSDHMPLILHLNYKSHNNDCETLPLLPKLNWLLQNPKLYHNIVNNKLCNEFFCSYGISKIGLYSTNYLRNFRSFSVCAIFF